MAKRLVKVAKELNVGTTTIVETLQKKGYNIKNRPTSKISDEMYDVLLKEFKGSIAIKEQADQLTFRSRQRKEAAEAARESERKRQEEARRKAEEERLKLEEERKKLEEARQRELARQREEEARKRAEEERKRKEEAEKRRQKEIADRIKLEGPKILGKVNLDKFNKKGVPNKKETPKPKKKVEGSNKKETQQNEGTSKKVEQSKQIRQARPTAKEQKKVQKVAPVVQKSEKVEKPKVEQPAVVNKKVESQPPVTEKPSEEMVRAETPKLKGLKIKGKIDLNRFNKPRKKEEKEDKKDGRQSDKVRKARVKKEVDKKTSGEGGDDKKRRRRKRKRIQKPETTGTGQNKTQNTGENKGKKDDTQKKPGEKKERVARVRKRATRPSRGGNSRNTGRKDEPKEVSQKEIEEKIKATMARLAGGGKSKRSKIRRESRIKTREQQNLAEKENELTKVQVTEFITVSELANVFDISATDVIMTCMNAGVIVSINQRLDAEIIELIAIEHEKEIEFISAEEQVEEEDEIVDDPADLVPRASIVTVMGHVDHGKTSLLDYIRKAKVAEGEAGGITQHIGAYEVKLPDGNITFLDTPGHEAFTAMRARGAKVTDIAIIIIAADDRIMPQTKEAISHAEAAGVPIVFAINKVDKPGAAPERIKQELAEMNYLVEDWGGKYQSQDISAKTGLGIEELLEKVVLEAEILELKANPKRDAVGVVLEASLDKGRGYVTKLLVQTGTLKIGSPIIAGAYAGKVRAMFDEKGKRVKKAGPAKPVMLLGLSGAPQAGDKFKVMDSDQETRALASKRTRLIREQQQRAMRRVSLSDIGRRIALGNFHELNVIVKGDVDGSIEALSDSLIKQSIESVQVKIIHRAVGPIKDSDILLASASDAIVIGFQVRPSTSAKQLAEKEGVEIKLYSVIYDAIEEIRSAIEGMLEPIEERKNLGEVEIREIYKIGKIGTIAGCYVKHGKVTRNSYIDIIRDGIVVYPKKEGVRGEIGSLKRFKDDAKEVTKGFECGLTIKNFNDIKVGDIVETYEIIEVKQTLKSIAKKKKKQEENNY